MEKRYNISLTYDQLVILNCIVRRNMGKRNENEYYYNLHEDALTQIDKAQKRAEKDIDKYNKQVIEERRKRK